MSRTYFARGIKGLIVSRMQDVLTAGGFYTGKVDGDYGGGTARAIGSAQSQLRIAPTGSVDESTWQGLMHAPIPSLFERCLQLTSCIEGHGFTMIAGNFDGAGLTWGIVGFTLLHGELQKIVLDVFASNPAVVNRSFGDRADELLRMMQAPAAQQMAWADSISTGRDNGSALEPWRSAFFRFGSEEIVQRRQLGRAHDVYFDPALETARGLGLTTELGAALCFDIHVQNGGIRKSTRTAIEAGRSPRASERTLRALIANSVADAAKPRWREDVRKRKLAIASGAGEVHGVPLALESWGLGEFPMS